MLRGSFTLYLMLMIKLVGNFHANDEARPLKECEKCVDCIILQPRESQ